MDHYIIVETKNGEIYKTNRNIDFCKITNKAIVSLDNGKQKVLLQDNIKSITPAH